MASSGQHKNAWRLRIGGIGLCLLLGLAIQHSSLGTWLDAKYLDLQTRALKKYFPTEVKNDVVVVGIDEATLEAFPEPMTLWHRHWGEFLRFVAVGAKSGGLTSPVPGFPGRSCSCFCGAGTPLR